LSLERICKCGAFEFAKRWKTIFVFPLHFLALQVQLFVFAKRFRGQNSLVSFLFAVFFFYSRCPPVSCNVGAGGHCWCF